MELSTVKACLELTGGPAFAIQRGTVAFSLPAAQELGILVGETIHSLLPDAVLPESGEGTLESEVVLAERLWTLRAAEAEDWVLCTLRPGQSQTPPPNESTLLYVAGSIRQALQDLFVAIDGAGDTVGIEGPQNAALAMRSVYRLRRTAGDLELFSRLRSGKYSLNRQRLALVSETDRFCRETAELLESANLHLQWKLPETELNAVLDWSLNACLLRELLVNAAAHAADRQLRLELSRVGTGRVCFSIQNQASGVPQDNPFHRYAAQERTDLEGGVGLGLSMVSQGAAFQGGSFLLSTDAEGKTTALLTLPLGAQTDDSSHSPIQFPETEPDYGLTAFSPILPPQVYSPENL